MDVDVNEAEQARQRDDELLVDHDLDDEAGVAMAQQGPDDRELAERVHAALITVHGSSHVEPRFRNGLIERYVEGRWQYFDGAEDDDRKLRKLILDRCGDARLTEARIRSIAAIVKTLCETAPPPTRQMRLGFSDRTVRIDKSVGLVFEDHDPSHDVRLRFPFPCPVPDYDPEFAPDDHTALQLAPPASVLLKRFTERLWIGAEDRGQRWEAWWRFCGATLFQTAPKYKRYVILSGREDGGKSQLVRMEEGVVQAAGGTVAHVEMNQMEDEYYRAVIASADLNSMADLDAGDVRRSGQFKQIIAGDESSGRFAYGRPFSFTPTCAHVYSCNELPASVDKSGGWWNRPIVLPFEQPVPEHLRVKGIMDQLLAEAMPQIVQLMIGGAVRLVLSDGHIIPPSAVEAANEWREEDPVRHFVRQCCAVIDEPSTPVNTLYYFYKPYAKAHGYAEMNVLTFGKRLRAMNIPWKKSSEMHYALVVLDQRILAMVDAFERVKMDAYRAALAEQAGDRREGQAPNLPGDSGEKPNN